MMVIGQNVLLCSCTNCDAAFLLFYSGLEEWVLFKKPLICPVCGCGDTVQKERYTTLEKMKEMFKSEGVKIS